MSPTARIFRIVVLALAGMVVVFFAVGFVLADRWTVDSNRLVTAPVPRIEQLILNFDTWSSWSGMTVELGPGIERAITGEPGTVGHSVVWTGAQGGATLRMSQVAPGRVDYEFLAQRSDGGDAELVGRGYIAYRSEGDGTRVEWHDEGRARNYLERWITWFGALQERVRQIQGTSLAGLQNAVQAR